MIMFGLGAGKGLVTRSIGAPGPAVLGQGGTAYWTVKSNTEDRLHSVYFVRNPVHSALRSCRKQKL